MDMIYGTTLFIGETQIDTKFGNFTTLTYQNLISSKNYVIALCYGDYLNQKTLYTRIHSSCVTSETLCGKDCDCVEQLNGALEKIAEKGCGILFYLIQEGRGAGYVAKSRDRMMVQYSKDTMSTFEAYQSIGLKNDHRDYMMIKEICYLLRINPKWVLLTNNPDKIEGLKNLGLNILRNESLEFKPNATNLFYLRSKQKYGHLLKETEQELPFPCDKELIKPFQPYNLPKINRFIHCSTYYLPILDEPHWFKVYVYYDISTSNDYVILEYDENKNKIPLVRIHSESIFSRFPLKNDYYKNIYQKSIEEIVKNGHGFVCLFYQDGRGHGLGTYVLDQISEMNGVTYDARDYHGISQLLRHHLTGDTVNLLITGFKNDEIIKQFNKLDIKISNLTFVGNDDLGHDVLTSRNMLIETLGDEINMFSQKRMDFDKKIFITGIGSSAPQAQYLRKLLKNNNFNIEFKPISSFKEYNYQNTMLILFSQGLSPNAQILFNYNFDDIILFTSVSKHPLFEKCSFICTYPLENEFGTLLRVVGPLYGFIAVNRFYNYLGFEKISNHFDKLEKIDEVINFMEKKPAVKIIFDSSIYNKETLENLKLKFLEGLFYHSTPDIFDFLDFSHGYYQNILYHNNQGSPNLVILLNPNEDIKNMLTGKCFLWELKHQNIIYYERIFNELILTLIKKWNINQKRWDGDDKQNPLYLKNK